MRDVLILLESSGLAGPACRRDRARPLRSVAAIWNPAQRSVDGDRDRGAVDGGLGRGEAIPGEPRASRMDPSGAEV